MSKIDFSDIPEIKRPSRVIKNPYYERIMREGFTIREYYNPEQAKKVKKGGLLSLRVDITRLDEEELAALEEYNKKNL